ncbi:iron-sulfur cluster assembly accessory protein [candidate division KSB1 bacterium]|nr:iron-sulfur cluster assembly accessory protein [candidate division KSB1 bacterium]
MKIVLHFTFRGKGVDMDHHKQHTAEPPVKISSRARKELIKLLNNENKEFSYLRIDVRAGNGHSLSYALGLVDRVSDKDSVYHVDGIDIAIAQSALSFVRGSELDYRREQDQEGFVFSQSAVHQGCGCGDGCGC